MLPAVCTSAIPLLSPVLPGSYHSSFNSGLPVVEALGLLVPSQAWEYYYIHKCVLLGMSQILREADITTNLLCFTADSESLVRGAPRVREIHLIRKIEKMYEHALQSFWSLLFGRGIINIVWQHYETEQGTL